MRSNLSWIKIEEDLNLIPISAQITSDNNYEIMLQFHIALP